ncbi:MBG domain-containing protein [Kiritimatiellaeota bacterium B1221]|nr:MBG domain-containing protein [Kiritimatiellaeota bacterium B1221]
MKSFSHLQICKTVIFSCLLSFGPSPLKAQPSNPSVRSGQVTVTPGVNRTQIYQASGRAIVNWGGFSIPAGHTVNIQQPSAQAALLNRVTGGNPSHLMGNLNANGKVYLINPNGIVVGNGARINTGAFIASTLDLSDQDFLAGGDLHFSGSSTAGVTNMGSITASNGDVILIGYRVSNQGNISSPHGVTALGAGREILLSPSSDQRLLILTSVEDSDEEDTEHEVEEETEDVEDSPVDVAGVENQGVIEAVQAELKAAGGNVYDLAVNQQGIIRATGVENRNGRVYLTSEQGRITHAGEISAHNVDGSGGDVWVGGDVHGGNPSVANALQTYVADTAVIDVSAQSPTGSGGKAVVWADDATLFEGRIDGQGGSVSGDGGFAEVSGKNYLAFRGMADVSAANGQSGSLLLDPSSLEIVSADQNISLNGTGPYIFEPTLTTASSTISSSTLESLLGAGNVILDTSFAGSVYDGSIEVNSSLTWTSGNELTLQSGNNIFINEDIHAAGAPVTFQLGYYEDVFSDANLIVKASATVTASEVVIERNPDTDLDYSTNNLDGPMGGVDFNGTLVTPVLDLRYSEVSMGAETGGFIGEVIFDNPANQIGTLRSTVSTGFFQEDLTVIDGSGGLIVDGTFQSSGGDITIVTPGDLTLSSGTSLITDGFDIHLASTAGSFINQAGASAVHPTNGGRFLIYSDDPANLSADGLVANPVYNKTWTGNAPSSLSQTGNRFVYTMAPTLTLTANPAAKNAGDSNPTFTFTISGLVGGDMASAAFSGTPDLTSAATSSSPNGTYTITITAGSVSLSDFDYALNLVNGLLTVDPSALPQLIIAVQNAIRHFGDPDPNFTVTYSGFQGGDTSAVVTGLQINTPAIESSSIGKYDLLGSGAAATGYDIVYQPGTLEIIPREITLRADNLTKAYGDDLPAFTTRYENLPPFASEADLGAVSVTSAASPRTVNAGTYSIVPYVFGNPNYNITLANGVATVEQREVTITAPTVSREYGVANPSFVAQSSNFVPGEFSNSLLSFSTPADPTSDVNSYALTASGYTDPNYSITYQPGAVNVTPAPLTYTVSNSSREYGLAHPSFTFTDDAGYRLGQGVNDVLEPSRQFETTATQGSSVGNYPVSLNATVINSNYDVTFVPGNLTITKAPLTLTPGLTHRSYGDDNPSTFALTGTGLRNGDSVSVVTGENFQVFASQTSDLGNYPVQILSATAQNYALTFTQGTLNVTPRAITIEADNKTREYGEDNPSFTSTILNLPDFASAQDIAGLALSSVATPTSNVLPGSGYAITVSTGSNPNYAISTLPGTLTLTPVDIEVYIGDENRSYTESNPAFSAEAGAGLKGSDTVNQLALSFDTTAIAGSSVGTYPITATAATPNYRVNVNPGELLITPATISVLGSGFTREYGDPLPSDYNLTVLGLQFGDQASDVTDIFDPTDFRTPIGTYFFQVASKNPNYVVDTVSGNSFQVLPRSLTINLEDSKRFYGDENEITFNGPTNLLPGLDPVDQILEFAGPSKFEPAGEYSIMASVINDNYRLVENQIGQLEILPRPLSIRINSETRDYGDDNPEFSYQVEGLPVPDFIDLDNVLDIETHLITDANSPSGFYIITNRATLDPSRYSLENLAEGVLTVTPRAITLSVADAQALFDGITDFSTAGNLNDLPYTLTASNLANGDTLQDIYTSLPVGTFRVSTTRELVSENYRDFMSAPDPRSADFVNGFASFLSLLPTETVEFKAGESLGFRVDPATDQRMYRGVIPGQEYLFASQNYVVTQIEPFVAVRTSTGSGSGSTDGNVISGIQTNTTPPGTENVPLPGADELDISEEFAPPATTYNPEVLKVVSYDDYKNNLGKLFSTYEDMTVKMIMTYLLDLYAGDMLEAEEGTTLYEAIFAGTDIEPPNFDEATIRAWLADVETNVEKRMLMGGALVNYLQDLQLKDPDTFTPGESLLVEVTLDKVNQKQKAMAESLLEKQATFEETPNASRFYYRARKKLKTETTTASKAALNFLKENAENLSPEENAAMEAVVASLIDGDPESAMRGIERWFEVREEGSEEFAINKKFETLLSNMTNSLEAMDDMQAYIDSGEDYSNDMNLKSVAMFDLVNAEQPFGEFLKESSYAELEVKMSKYKLLSQNSGLVSAAAGVGAGAVAGGATFAVANVTTIGAIMFPAALHSKAYAGAAAAGGVGVKSSIVAIAPAIVVAAAGFATTWAGIEIVQNDEQEAIFNELVNAGSTKMTFADMDMTPQTKALGKNPKAKDVADNIFKTMLVDSLDEMLMGM